MNIRAWLFALALALPQAGHAAPPAPVEVMIVGDYHMANPGHDLHNMKADDVLAPDRQRQIATVTGALARFRPTKVAVEWPADIVVQRYQAYRAGTLAPSRDESVQLGFRLARTAGLVQVFGIDVGGEFPYDAVADYAKTHGEGAMLDEAGAKIEAMVKTQEALERRGVASVLRYLNDPARLKSDNDFYRATLRIGGGATQPGAELLTAWYHRNFLICANLIQLSKPGDRIVVFYGSGHAFLLRQCVAETPGLRLVEPNIYLPR